MLEESAEIPRQGLRCLKINDSPQAANRSGVFEVSREGHSREGELY